MSLHLLAHVAAALLLLGVLLWRLLRRRTATVRGWPFWLAVLVLALTGGVMLARSTPVWMLYGMARTPVTSTEGILDAARATVRGAGVCFLVTLDDAGRPDARMMQPFPLDPDMTVWLGTQRGTRKLAQLARDPRATLACYDPATMGYATFVGTARVVDEPAQRRVHYSAFWDQFFHGPDDPTYVLLRLTPEELRVVSYGRAVAINNRTWRAATLVARRGRWAPGD